MWRCFSQIRHRVDLCEVCANGRRSASRRLHSSFGSSPRLGTSTCAWKVGTALFDLRGGRAERESAARASAIASRKTMRAAGSIRATRRDAPEAAACALRALAGLQSSHLTHESSGRCCCVRLRGTFGSRPVPPFGKELLRDFAQRRPAAGTRRRRARLPTSPRTK